MFVIMKADFEKKVADIYLKIYMVILLGKARCVKYETEKASFGRR